MITPGQTLKSPFYSVANSMPASDKTHVDGLLCSGGIRVTNAFMGANSWYDGEKPGRPFMHIIGECVSLKGDLPSDVHELNFEEGKGIPVDYFYEFTDEELADLVTKGLYTPEFKCPDAIYKNIVEMPLSCNFTILEPKAESDFPILFADINNSHSMVTNSAECGYVFSDYFEKPEVSKNEDLLDLEYKDVGLSDDLLASTLFDDEYNVKESSLESVLDLSDENKVESEKPLTEHEKYIEDYSNKIGERVAKQYEKLNEGLVTPSRVAELGVDNERDALSADDELEDANVQEQPSEPAFQDEAERDAERDVTDEFGESDVLEDLESAPAENDVPVEPVADSFALPEQTEPVSVTSEPTYELASEPEAVPETTVEVAPVEPAVPVYAEPVVPTEPVVSAPVYVEPVPAAPVAPVYTEQVQVAPVSYEPAVEAVSVTPEQDAEKHADLIKQLIQIDQISDKPLVAFNLSETAAQKYMDRLFEVNPERVINNLEDVCKIIPDFQSVLDEAIRERDIRRRAAVAENLAAENEQSENYTPTQTANLQVPDVGSVTLSKPEPRHNIPVNIQEMVESENERMNDNEDALGD